MRSVLGSPGKMESSWEGAVQQCFQHSGEAFLESSFIRGCYRQGFPVSLLWSYALAFCPRCHLHACMFCWLPALDFNNQANQPTFDGTLGVSRHLQWYKDFSRLLTKALKISASPCILTLNKVQFLQGLAVRIAASSLIIRNSLGNYTQHLLQFFDFTI